VVEWLLKKVDSAKAYNRVYLKSEARWMEAFSDFSERSLNISLFFADDVIFFTRASIDQARVINLTLQEICNALGMAVNSSKV
jgi:hypothetical protein